MYMNSLSVNMSLVNGSCNGSKRSGEHRRHAKKNKITFARTTEMETENLLTTIKDIIVTRYYKQSYYTVF